jgi:polygalacturonase
VRLEGSLVKDSPSFGVRPIHCRQARIEGLRIDSLVQPNSDGIDVDVCQDVFIANCSIHSGDDGIALKTIEPGAACRDVVITNCILSSLCAAKELLKAFHAAHAKMDKLPVKDRKLVFQIQWTALP